MQRAGGKTKPLTDVTELIGKDVYVKPGKYYDRLVNLDKELGGGIHIHKVTNDSISVEDLITQVSQGKIPYTVADNDVARLNTTYYPNLNIKLSISFDQRASWAVRKDSPELAAAANKWHEENMTSPAYTASMKDILRSVRQLHTLLSFLFVRERFHISTNYSKVCFGNRLGLAVACLFGIYGVEL